MPAMSKVIAHALPVSFAAAADVIENAAMRRGSRRGRIATQVDEELLEPDAVDPVVLHPAEMTEGRGRIVGAEQLGGLAILDG